MFTEAFGWKHGDEFLCVAFQHKVAYVMKGRTMHSAADLGIGNTTYERQLQHPDVDLQFIRDQCSRWIMIDEISMVPDELLGAVENKQSYSAI